MPRISGHGNPGHSFAASSFSRMAASLITSNDGWVDNSLRRRSILMPITTWRSRTRTSQKWCLPSRRRRLRPDPSPTKRRRPATSRQSLPTIRQFAAASDLLHVRRKTRVRYITCTGESWHGAGSILGPRGGTACEVDFMAVTWVISVGSICQRCNVVYSKAEAVCSGHLTGRGESRCRPVRRKASGHRDSETRRKPNDSPWLSVSVASTPRLAARETTSATGW